MTQRSCRGAAMRYFGRRGAAFTAFLVGIFFHGCPHDLFWDPFGCWFGTLRKCHFNPDRASADRAFALHRLAMADPISAGERTVVMPAASSASNLAAAVPLPPATMAPACPIRLPGGAATPAIYATTGLVTFLRMYAAAASSSLPPIFAHHHDAFGLRILFEQLQHIDEVHAADGIAADADAGALAQPIVGGLEHRFVG